MAGVLDRIPRQHLARDVAARQKNNNREHESLPPKLRQGAVKYAESVLDLVALVAGEGRRWADEVVRDARRQAIVTPLSHGHNALCPFAIQLSHQKDFYPCRMGMVWHSDLIRTRVHFYLATWQARMRQPVLLRERGKIRPLCNIISDHGHARSVGSPLISKHQPACAKQAPGTGTGTGTGG